MAKKKRQKGGDGKSEADRIKGEIAALQDKCRELEGQAASGTDRIRKLKKKIEAVGTNGPNDKVREEVIAEFLRKRGFTQAQVSC